MRCWAGAALATAVVIGAATAAPSPARVDAAADPALPQRILDTRQGAGALAPGQVRRVDLPAAGDGAVALNLTADRAAGAGWVSAWSCADPQPRTSILNVVPGHPVANMVALAATDAVCFTASTQVDLIVDVTRSLDRADYAGVAPTRLLDTRESRPLAARQEFAVEVAGRAGIPGDAAGAALNVTVVAGARPGWVSVAPCGAPAGSSTANFGPGEIVPHFTFTGLAGGRTCITANTPVDVVVDAFGALPAGTALTPVEPSRVLDTRNGVGGTRGAVADGQTVRVRVAGYGGVPNSALGATVNVVAVESGAAGHVTAWPCGSALPEVSTLNMWSGATRANQATLGLSAEGELCLQPRLADGSAVHLVVDAVGTVAGEVQRPEPPPTTAPPVTVPPTTPPTDPGGNRFTTLPVGATLPSGAECAGRVRPAPEIRPQNAAANSTRGTSSNDNTDWPGFQRVDGDFVGTTDEASGEVVAIYRGPSEPLFGIDLSRLVETSSITVASLPEFEQEQVTSSIAASSLTDAREVVDRLQTEATSCADPNPPAGCPESP